MWSRQQRSKRETTKKIVEKRTGLYVRNRWWLLVNAAVIFIEIKKSNGYGVVFRKWRGTVTPHDSVSFKIRSVLKPPPFPGS